MQNTIMFRIYHNKFILFLVICSSTYHFVGRETTHFKIRFLVNQDFSELNQRFN